MVASGWRGASNGSYCLMSMKFQFEKMRKVLEMDGGDSCTTM